MSEHEQSSNGSGVVTDGMGGSRVTDPELLEKAILNEAPIKEQIRFGRRWQLKDHRDRTADVDFA